MKKNPSIQFINSIKNNYRGMVLMLISAITISFAQYLWKLAENTNLFFLLTGVILYGIASILMIIAYRYGSLSLLHPILSLSYGFGLFFGFFLLHEQISFQNILGVIIITIGVIFIGGGD